MGRPAPHLSHPHPDPNDLLRQGFVKIFDSGLIGACRPADSRMTSWKTESNAFPEVHEGYVERLLLCVSYLYYVFNNAEVGHHTILRLEPPLGVIDSDIPGHPVSKDLMKTPGQ